MRNDIRTSMRATVFFTVLTGLVYPWSVTAIGRALWPRASEGSLVYKDGRVVGSRWIGQPFRSPKYVWPRPSATLPPFNGGSSMGSNLGLAHPDLARAWKDRLNALRDADPGNPLPVPIELLAASGSGLDPDISPAAADYQAARVARARGISESAVRDMIRTLTRPRAWGMFGEPSVNVLELNLALDERSRG